MPSDPDDSKAMRSSVPISIGACMFPRLFACKLACLIALVLLTLTLYKDTANIECSFLEYLVGSSVDTTKAHILSSGGFHQVKGLSNREVWVPATTNTLDSGIVQAVRKGEMWSPGITDQLRKFALPGSTAVDAGVLWGSLTFVLSDAVGPTGHVHSFEPQPWCYEGVKKTIQHNSQLQFHDKTTINLHNVALSDKIGKMGFCADGTGSSNIISDSFMNTVKGRFACAMPRKKDGAATNILPVDVKTMDSFGLTNVSCIKIDVEGHEVSVIKGALNTIKTFRPAVVVEIKEKNLEEFKGLMTTLGYKGEQLGGEDWVYLWGA